VRWDEVNYTNTSLELEDKCLLILVKKCGFVDKK